MIRLYADGVRLTVTGREALASGSVGAVRAAFTFTGDWSGLTKTAVFKAGGVARSVLLDDACACLVPWECLTDALVGRTLYIGVVGTRDTTVVYPAVYADAGPLMQGADPDADASSVPTPGLYQQMAAAFEETEDAVTAQAESAAASAEAAGTARAQAEAARDAAEAAVGRTSYIGENGDWYEWDAEAGAFTDTGVPAGTAPLEAHKTSGDHDGRYYTESETDALLAAKADKEDGKGLSSNDYTDAEQAKLSGVEAGAQVNAVDSVNARTGAVVLDTDEVNEGSANQYFTQARAQAAIAAVSGADTGSVFYKDASGGLVHLGIGGEGQKLTVSGGLPVWTNDWRVAVSLTLSEAVSAFTVTQDDDGNALNVKSMRIWLQGGANAIDNGSLSYIRYIINDNTDVAFIERSTTNMTLAPYLCGMRNLAFAAYYEIGIRGSHFAGSGVYWTKGYDADGSTFKYTTYDPSASSVPGFSFPSVTKFYLYCSAFPAGTKLHIEVIDA